MAIDGLSQSSGVERLLEVAPADQGVLFVIRDREGNIERERMVLPVDDVLTTLTDRPEGGSTIESIMEGEGAENGRSLAIEVRRNEVWLTPRSGTGEGCDVAVGLDDLLDALAEVLPSA